MFLFHSAKFLAGDEVRVRNRPPAMGNNTGVVRRVFLPTPAGVWRYLLYHKGYRARKGVVGPIRFTRPFVQAYDEQELEAL